LLIFKDKVYRMIAVIEYLTVGCFAGFMAGLLGVGGGLIVVPGLIFGFAQLGLADNISLHMALGTSLATILFTSFFSIKAHNKQGFVRWDIVKPITPGILLGTFIGAQIVGLLSAQPLRWFFVGFLILVAAQMLLELKPKVKRGLPKKFGMSTAGGMIGFISSFIGIGGGALSVPFMGWCSVPIREAIGTSAALSFPIALAGAIGNIYRGFNITGLPEWSLGYVYLPALAVVVAASMPMAYVGAKVAHRLPVMVLKKIFASMLIFIAIYMIYRM
jgi:uncharacterized membrane protein YfcA